MQLIEMDCGCVLNTHTDSIIKGTWCPVHGIVAPRRDEPEPFVPRVADLPCLKCGHDEVGLVWISGTINVCGVNSLCWETRRQSEEHFHRTCQRCHYQWPTYDMLS